MQINFKKFLILAIKIFMVVFKNPDYKLYFANLSIIQQFEVNITNLNLFFFSYFEYSFFI